MTSAEKWAFPQVFVLHRLASTPHAACQLAHPPGFPRTDVDRCLRWLKRRKLVEYDGAWKLTDLGRLAEKHSTSSAKPADGESSRDAI